MNEKKNNRVERISTVSVPVCCIMIIIMARMNLLNPTTRESKMCDVFLYEIKINRQRDHHVQFLVRDQ